MAATATAVVLLQHMVVQRGRLGCSKLINHWSISQFNCGPSEVQPPKLWNSLQKAERVAYWYVARILTPPRPFQRPVHIDHPYYPAIDLQKCSIIAEVSMQHNISVTSFTFLPTFPSLKPVDMMTTTAIQTATNSLGDSCASLDDSDEFLSASAATSSASTDKWLRRMEKEGWRTSAKREQFTTYPCIWGDLNHREPAVHMVQFSAHAHMCTKSKWTYKW